MRLGASLLLLVGALAAAPGCDGGASPGGAGAAGKDTTTRYIDNGPRSQCDDSGAATRAEPWCSLAPLIGATFGAGDAIRLRRGRAWRLPSAARRGLWLSGSGSRSAPVTLGAYGPAHEPLPVVVGRRADTHRSGGDVAIGITGSWWRVEDLEIRGAGVALVAYGSPSGRVQRGLHFLRLRLRRNRNGISVSASPRGRVVDVRIQDVEAVANGSGLKTSPAKVACPPGNPPGRIDTVHGVDLYLGGVSGAVVERAWFHDGLDGAIAIVADSRDVVVKSSRFDRMSGSYASCGTTANYLTDASDIAYVNSTFTRTANSGSGDQSGMDADSDVDRLRVWSNYFAENTGPGLEILQNSEREAAAPQGVDVRGNVFVDNSLAEPYGLRGGVMTGWAAPRREVRPTGRITDNLYFEPTGFTWVYRRAGGSYGFSGFDFANNVRLDSRRDVHHAAAAFACARRPRSAWLYEWSRDGLTWRSLSACHAATPTDERWRASGGGQPWVSRFEQSAPAAMWVARSWRAPRAGTVAIRSRAIAAGPSGRCRVRAAIRLRSSSTPRWSATVSAERKLGVAADVDRLRVVAGEIVRFAVRGAPGCRVSWVPALAYVDR